MTQEQKVLKHLQEGKTLTQLEALYAGMGFRLSDKIFKLRAKGHNITTTMVKVDKNTFVAQYSLKDEKE